MTETETMQKVFLLRCNHCGKEITGPSEFRTMQGLRAHLKGCARRKKPIEIVGKTRDFKVWVRPYQLRQEIEEFTSKILGMEDLGDAEPMILGYLLRVKAEMKNRQKDFRFEVIPKPANPGQ